MPAFFRLIGIISAPGAPKMRLKMTSNFYDLGTGRTNAPSHDLQNLSIDVAVVVFPEDSVLASSGEACCCVKLAFERSVL